MLQTIKDELSKEQQARQDKLGETLEQFFHGLDRVFETCAFFQDISLYHQVIKEEIESIQTLKPVFDSEMNKLSGMFTAFMTNLEQLTGGEEFKSEDFKKLANEMKQLNCEQNNLLFKIKLKEASLISCATLQDTLDEVEYQNKTEEYPSLSQICENLLSVIGILLSDQGTVLKKWSNIISSAETVDIGGQDYQIKLDDSVQ